MRSPKNCLATGMLFSRLETRIEKPGKVVARRTVQRLIIQHAVGRVDAKLCEHNPFIWAPRGDVSRLHPSCTRRAAFPLCMCSLDIIDVSRGPSSQADAARRVGQRVDFDDVAADGEAHQQKPLSRGSDDSRSPVHKHRPGEPDQPRENEGLRPPRAAVTKASTTSDWEARLASGTLDSLCTRDGQCGLRAALSPIAIAPRWKRPGRRAPRTCAIRTRAAWRDPIFSRNTSSARPAESASKALCAAKLLAPERARAEHVQVRSGDERRQPSVSVSDAIRGRSVKSQPRKV